MGIFSVTIEMANVHGETFEEVEVTVDTASDYTTVPRHILERIGVPVTGTAISEMADGREVPSDAGWARVRLQSDDIYTRIIFGKEGEASLLGAIALETARLGVDLNNKRLTSVNVRRY